MSELQLENQSPISSPQSILPWYVIRVRTRAELKVADALRSKGFEVFCPTFIEARQYSNRIKNAEVALFGGYTFCRLDPQITLPIVSTPGVQDIVGFGAGPTSVPEIDIKNIQRVVAKTGVAVPWPYLKSGQRVRISVGSMKGVEGILINHKGTDQLVISIEMLQRSIALEVERSWVQPIL